jgi:hypothetical protein
MFCFRVIVDFVDEVKKAPESPQVKRSPRKSKRRNSGPRDERRRSKGARQLRRDENCEIILCSLGDCTAAD